MISYFKLNLSSILEGGRQRRSEKRPKSELVVTHSQPRRNCRDPPLLPHSLVNRRCLHTSGSCDCACCNCLWAAAGWDFRSGRDDALLFNTRPNWRIEVLGRHASVARLGPVALGKGHDAVHANELSMSQSTDRDILDTAEAQGRVVITADLDFPCLFAELHKTGPGLILLRRGNYSESESLDCIRRVLMAVQEQQLPKMIVVVDHKRIRRR